MCTGLNALCTASGSFSATTASMLIYCAINADMVVFRLFSDSVALRNYIFIIELNLILNGVLSRNMCIFTNIKYAPRC